MDLVDLGPERKAETIASNSLVLSLATDDGFWTVIEARGVSLSLLTPTNEADAMGREDSLSDPFRRRSSTDVCK